MEEVGASDDWKPASKLKIFPIVESLRGYNPAKAKSDAKAAINVALLDFPQGMAYALLAGLPVQFGIFCSSLASLVGPFFASSRFVMLGPTNATAVMLLSAFLTLGYSPAQAMAAMPVLLLMVAAFMIAGAFFRVASITSYISRSVVVGYITAAAGLIIVNQLKTAFGMDIPRAGTFIESLVNLVRGIGTFHGPSAIVGAMTLGIYLLLRRWGSRLPVVALTLILASMGTALLGLVAGLQVAMLDPVRIDAWPLSMPKLDWADFNGLANAALAIAFLSLLESSSIAKTLAAKAGDSVDLNQQMLSMGAASCVCAFGSGMAVSGSLTRSILNYQSGAKTPVSSIFSGLLLALGVVLLGDWIGLIPKPALAVMVVLVGLSLINPRQILVMIRTTKSDATVLLGTLLGGLLLPLDTAIYLGAVLSIALFVRKAARPELKEISFDETGNLVENNTPRTRPEIAIVHVEGDLFFASSDIFLEQMRHLVAHPAQKVIILRLRNAHHLDATAAMTIGDLIRFARSHGREILVSGAHPTIEAVFRRSQLMDLLGENNFFRYNEGNPNVSTRHALQRAQEITGVTSADITIFAAEKKG
jgi:sulfate permease, SulP family